MDTKDRLKFTFWSVRGYWQKQSKIPSSFHATIATLSCISYLLWFFLLKIGTKEILHLIYHLEYLLPPTIFGQHCVISSRLPFQPQHKWNLKIIPMWIFGGHQSQPHIRKQKLKMNFYLVIYILFLMGPNCFD